MLSFSTYLNEKLIVLNNGARYGQIVFLAGGPGSGKGFARDTFMEGDKFKVIDVDEWKKEYQRLSDMFGKYPEIRGLNLRNPNDVEKLHLFVKAKGIKEFVIASLLGNGRPGELPNILFDFVLKDLSDMTSILPKLLAVGYQPRNIHIVWVLTGYEIAVEQNRKRSRVVPDDILLKGHEGAAVTMWSIINHGPPAGVDGQISVILNNPSLTVKWVDTQRHDITNVSGKPIVQTAKLIQQPYADPKTGDRTVKVPLVKSFTYVTVKKPGQPMESESAVKDEVYEWILDAVPRTEITKSIWPELGP
jgi:hypothetical protein